ncbi:hypothetical protein DMUE_5393 [Dictyocoela muelleri]|nr:hypothetical protein DMUE_5393 [Dictyocoela muelleri]
MRPYKSRTNLGIFDLMKYISSETIAKSVLERLGVLPISRKCPICQKMKKKYEGKGEYFYCSKKCNIMIALKYNTILQGMNIKFMTFIFFVYFYFYQKTMTKA